MTESGLKNCDAGHSRAVSAGILCGTPARLDSNLKHELPKWAGVAKTANIKLD